MAEAVKLSVEDKSAWQLDDCPHRRPGCKQTATREAVAASVSGRTLPHIRTCDNPKCIDAAKASVLKSIKALEGAKKQDENGPKKKGSKKKGIR